MGIRKRGGVAWAKGGGILTLRRGVGRDPGEPILGVGIGIGIGIEGSWNSMPIAIPTPTLMSREQGSGFLRGSWGHSPHLHELEQEQVAPWGGGSSAVAVGAEQGEVDGRLLAVDQLGDELASDGAERETHHGMAGGDDEVGVAACATDVRESIR